MPIQQKQQRKLDYHRVLRDVAKTMVRLKKPERLVKLITRLIDREMAVNHTSLLVLEEQRNRFIFVDSKGSGRVPVGLVKMEKDHPLIQLFLNKKKRILSQEDQIHIP